MTEAQTKNAGAQRVAAPSTWKLACLCAVTDGVPRRSLYVALVVGTVLNLINQGDAILAMAGVNWLKVALTYCVPYAVCTYGACNFQVDNRLGPDRNHAPDLLLLQASALRKSRQGSCLDCAKTDAQTQERAAA